MPFPINANGVLAGGCTLQNPPSSLQRLFLFSRTMQPASFFYKTRGDMDRENIVFSIQTIKSLINPTCRITNTNAASYRASTTLADRSRKLPHSVLFTSGPFLLPSRYQRSDVLILSHKALPSSGAVPNRPLVTTRSMSSKCLPMIRRLGVRDFWVSKLLVVVLASEIRAEHEALATRKMGRCIP